MLLFKLCADIGAEAGFLSVEKSVEKFGKLALIHFPFSIAGKGKTMSIAYSDICFVSTSAKAIRLPYIGELPDDLLPVLAGCWPMRDICQEAPG